TTPSAAALIAFAYGVGALGDVAGAPWLHGLKIVAVAVVAQAVWGMARTLCPDRARLSLAVAATGFVFAVPSAGGQIGAIVLGGLIGLILLKADPGPPGHEIAVAIGGTTAIAALAVFFGLLIALPLVAASSGDQTLKLTDSFYRAGSLVFGGG